MSSNVPKSYVAEGEVLAPETDNGNLSKILCVFCSAPWDESNIRLYDLDAADQCASGRFDAENCTVSIVCHACGREMYRKEGFEIGW
jgi:hypothetical protein